MAVTSIKRTACKGRRDTKGIHIQEMYDVQTNSRTDLVDKVLEHPDLPQSYDEFEDTGATLRSLDADYKDGDASRMLWEVTAAYSSVAGESDGGDGTIQIPVNKPAIWSGSYLMGQKPLVEDVVTGLPILNSAQDLFDEAVIVDDSQPVLQCEKNFATIDLNFWLTFKDAVNNAPWGPFARRQAKVQQISFRQMSHDDIPFYKVVMSFQIKLGFEVGGPPIGWLIKLWSTGWRERVDVLDASKGLQVVVDPKTGNIPPRPWFLDNVGKAITDPSEIANDKEALYFNGYRELPFATLGIPQPIDPF